MIFTRNLQMPPDLATSDKKHVRAKFLLFEFNWKIFLWSYKTNWIIKNIHENKIKARAHWKENWKNYSIWNTNLRENDGLEGERKDVEK